MVIAPLIRLGNEASAKGWTVMSMKDDWKAIFPPAK